MFYKTNKPIETLPVYLFLRLKDTYPSNAATACEETLWMKAS